MMRLNKTSSQRGSALIYVIIGVALFGMLIYTVMRGGSTSSSIGTTGNAKTQAMAILEFSRSVQGEVNRMLAAGISENQIDGDSNIYSRWAATPTNRWNANVNCSSTACKLFVSKGGKVPDTTFRTVATAYSSGYSSAHPYPGDPALSQINLTGVGTSKYDLAIIVARLNLDVCKELNKLVGAPASASTINENYGAFGRVGTPSAGEPYYAFDQFTGIEPVGDQNTALVGKQSACAWMSTYGYVFYYTLIAR